MNPDPKQKILAEYDKTFGRFGKDEKFIEHRDFLFDSLTTLEEEVRWEMNDCTCKEKWTFGVVHRKDLPCYLAPRL